MLNGVVTNPIQNQDRRSAAARTARALVLTFALVIGVALGLKWMFDSVDRWRDARRIAGVQRSTPDPSLSAGEVVRLQLAGLQENDRPHPDAGVEMAYGFMSPERKAEVGELEHFSFWLHHPPFAPLLHHQGAWLMSVSESGDRAQVPVVVKIGDHEAAAYVFHLTRQQDGPHPGAWLVDGFFPAAGLPSPTAEAD
jgi:hypothetical protein